MMTNICNITFDLSKVTPDNITVFVVGIIIVFAALITLYLIFDNIPKLLKIKIKKSSSTVTKNKTPQLEGDMSGEEATAIALALHLFLNEQHDEESYISTIKRVERRYSPWSSKIYGVRNQFNRY